jgi:drug/metabolite transporter (DMT)-like permease
LARVHATVYLRLVATAFLWSLAFYSVSAVVQVFPVLSGAFFRFFFACLLLAALTHFYGAWPSFLEASQRRDLLFLGIVGVFFYNAFFFIGLRFSDPVTGSLIVAANPAVTATVSSVWKKEHSSILRWLGILISFAGLLLVFSRGELRTITDLEFQSGDLFVFAASICWALYSVKGRDVLRSQPLLGTTTVACLIGCMLLLPAAIGELYLFTGTSDLVSTAGRWRLALAGLIDMFRWEHTTVWLNLMYLGFFASGIAFLFWYQGVRALGAPRTAIFINLVPLFAMAISIASGSWPHGYQWAGAAIVLTGVYITTRSGTVAGEKHESAGTDDI